MTVDRSIPAEIEDVLALSPLQEGLFSLARLAADGVDLYTMQFVIDISGPIDVPMLRRSAEAILQRHANLRAAFWDKDLPKPVQIVPTWVDLPWLEISALPAEFDAIAEADRQQRFDLSRGPALRITLVTLPEERHRGMAADGACGVGGAGRRRGMAADGACGVGGAGRRRMIVTAHHILMDGWAVAVFFRELIAVYEAGGQADSLPPARPYRDYIGWLAAQDTAASIRSWTEYLAPLSGPLMLAAGTATEVGAAIPRRTRFSLDNAETARLVQWARTNGLTMSTVVQFAWAIVLGRLTDRRDVVFGTTISGRPDALPGVETMIGLFINTVPARVLIDRNRTVAEQCAQLQRESATMRDAGYVSLSTIQRAAGHGALFDVLFVFENAPIGAATDPIVTAGGTRFLPVAMESLVHYPLSAVSHLTDGTLVVMLEAIAEALPHFPIGDIGERILSVLRQLPDLGDSSPDALDLLLADEKVVVAESRDSANGTAYELFLNQVASTPDAIALSTGSDRYTYRELRTAAGQLANELIAAGIGPEAVVALALPRSARSIVAILAVLEAGGAYVPVDISAPVARIESILRQAHPKLILTVGESANMLGETTRPVLVLDDPDVAERIANHPITPYRPVSPQTAAYLIFTSGSTGEPKGVIGTHAALTSYFTDHRDRVYRPAVARLGRRLRIAHAWSLSFDASWQPMIGLFDGHAVHLFDESEMRDAQGLVDGIVRHEIDMIDTSPSMFTQLSAAGLVDGERLTVLALGGEAIGAPMWEQLRALPGTSVYNCYGPTETTVEAVVATVNTGSNEPGNAKPTIGGPVDRMSAYVFDAMLRRVPRGVAGELYLSGAQVARGYIGKSASTADRFVADPFRPGSRMYRTGDLVRQLPNGDLAYLGRADDQVKIRGYRIEIGDIETALLQLPQVRAGAILVVQRPTGPSLVAFAVGADPADLRAGLAARLPAYMVPARVISLPDLPVTPNGKLDVRALHALGLAALRGSGQRTLPSTDTERILCRALSEALGGTTPGIDDDFIELGMDSIVAISLVNAVRRAGLSVSPAIVMTNPTVRDLAAAIDSRAAQRESRPAEIGEVVPTPIMSWMYEYGGFRRLALSTLISLPPEADRAGVEAVLQALVDGHDMLRGQLSTTGFQTRAQGSVRAADILHEVRVSGDFGAVLEEHARAAIDRIDPKTGTMIQAVRFAGPDVLLLSIHHLAVDPVSLHIILADLADAWSQLARGQTATVAPESTGYRSWAELLDKRRTAPEVSAQRDFWTEQLTGPDPELGLRHPDPTRDTWSSYRLTPSFTPTDTTRGILDGLGMHELLLTALTIALTTWRTRRNQDGSTGALVALEGHGREDATVGDVDTSRTVGWFTTVYPLRVGTGSTLDITRAESDPAETASLLKAVAAQLDSVPNKGLDYGLLRYGENEPQADPQVVLDYLGRMDLTAGTSGPWTAITDLSLHQRLPVAPEPDMPLRYALDLVVAVYPSTDGPQLATLFRWSEALFDSTEIDRFATLWQRCVTAVAAAIPSPTSGER
ncbi:amino acid adenylation domain-containing protein [Nocardia sp. CA-135398]|uniref:amino acid adenylation domain-containing protein n=1 Tax=Nocardia sp. CA-135398 TaxID=3239977 RepID=UPI003D96630B